MSFVPFASSKSKKKGVKGEASYTGCTGVMWMWHGHWQGRILKLDQICNTWLDHKDPSMAQIYKSLIIWMVENLNLIPAYTLKQFINSLLSPFWGFKHKKLSNPRANSTVHLPIEREIQKWQRRCKIAKALRQMWRRQHTISSPRFRAQ